jgi:hypothetical protein
MTTLSTAILEVLAADHPQSVRHVFYRMTDPRLPEPVEKSDKGYRHVQHRVTELRRSGRLPYGWITDATRHGYFVNTFRSPVDFLRRMSGLYRADLWSQADAYVEVWCESRSIAGVIQSTCEDLAVSLYPCGGFSSITLPYEAAQDIHIETDQGRRSAHILYLGDYDPAGVLIDVSLEVELRRHLDAKMTMRTGPFPLKFHRLAITEEQIKEHDLPRKPRKAGDKRSAHILDTVEVEAMPAHILRDLLRSEIEKYLPEQALHVARVAEESERDFLLTVAANIEGAHP